MVNSPRFSPGSGVQKIQHPLYLPPLAAQTPLPANPDQTGARSSSSTESKPEPYAQNFATEFIAATCITVNKWLKDFDWSNPGAKVRLSPQSCPKILCSNGSRNGNKIGKSHQVTAAIDDGCISMNFRRLLEDPYLSRRVVLSVEIFTSILICTLCRRNRGNM